MCVAIYKPAGVKTPDLDTLKLCWDANPDGAGIAFPSNQRPNMLEIRKGYMTWESFAEAYDKLALDKMEAYPLLLHFRIATAGNVDAGNTHPFPISKYQNTLRLEALFAKYALIHNGVLDKFKPQNDVISDTIQFAIKIANTGCDPMRVFPKFKKLIGDSRMALMDKNGSVQLLGEWTDFDGIMFSNEIWQYGGQLYEDWHYGEYSDLDFAMDEYYELFPDGDGFGFEEYLYYEHPDLYEEYMKSPSGKSCLREFGYC